MANDADLFDGERISSTYVDGRLVRGSAVLMAGGLLIWLTGATAGIIALMGAGRRYVAARDEPPLDTVRRRWEQARVATGAGVGAWQGHGLR
jgi:hypothetical protein